MPSASCSTDRAARFAASMVGAVPFVLLLSFLLLIGFSRGVVAQETSEETSKGKTSGDGGASIDGGEVYAGDGCARAGDVVAGDCDEKGGDEDAQENTSPGTLPSESTSQESTFPDGGTTGFGSTSPEKTSEITALEETAPQEEENLCPTEPSGETLDASVERVVDGDTLELTEEVGGTDQVRLAGVDAPELEGEDGAPEPYAEEAVTFTSEALEGEDVLLEVGEEETDEAGRLLAYVWAGGTDEGGFMSDLKRMVGTDGSELFNRVLLEEGYAEALTVEPNDPYARCFGAAEQAARNGDTGAGGTSGGLSDAQYGEQGGLEVTAEQTFSEGTTREETILQEETGEQAPPDVTTEQSSPESASPETGPSEEDLDQEPVGDEPAAGQERAQYPSTEPPPTDEQATLPLTREAAEAPVEGTAYGPDAPDQRAASPQSYAAEPDVREDHTAPLSSLPTRESSGRSVSVLPETGGASLLPLLIGACCLAGGVSCSIATGRVLCRHGFRPEGR